MASSRWTEEETKLALYLYFQLPFGKLHSKNPEIKQLADSMGRSHSSVAMKLCNFASLDPKITATGRKGLEGASKLDRKVFEQFFRNWNGLVVEAGILWTTTVDRHDPLRLHENTLRYKFEPFEGPSTSVQTVQQRLGQGFFRRAVLANFDERCCITGIADTRLLNASHIRPWGVDIPNRHNPANGFALSATFDRAFDRGLITITPDGHIKISDQLKASPSHDTRRHFSPFHGKRIHSPVRFDLDASFLEWHNQFCYMDR